MEPVDLRTDYGASESLGHGTVVANNNSTAARAVRIARQRASAASKADQLDDILGDLRVGDSWHVITSGNIDAGSFLEVLIARYGPFEHAYISTWRINREYINRLSSYLDDHKLGGFTLFTGDYFAARYPDDYTRVCNLADSRNGRVYRWKNHAKMFALRNAKTEWACILETSANMTGNPRTEQTSITVDADLYKFYRDWFNDTAASRKQYRIQPGA